MNTPVYALAPAQHTPEAEVRAYLEDQGYTVLHRGWPDLMAYKATADGLCVRYVEVKGPRDHLSTHQTLMLPILDGNATGETMIARVTPDWGIFLNTLEADQRTYPGDWQRPFAPQRANR